MEIDAILFLVVAFLGAIGNIHTLYVFGKHFEDNSYRTISIWLTSCDLVACVIYVPTYQLSYPIVHYLGSQFVCSLIYLINWSFYLYSTIRYSALIIILVLKQKGKLSSKLTNVVFVIVLIVCILLAIPDAILVEYQRIGLDFSMSFCAVGSTLFFLIEELFVLVVSLICIISALVLFCIAVIKHKKTGKYQNEQENTKLATLNDDNAELDEKQEYGSILKQNRYDADSSGEQNFDYIENKTLFHITWFSCMLYVVGLTVTLVFIGNNSTLLFLIKVHLLEHILKPVFFLCLDPRFRGFSARVNVFCKGITKVLKCVMCCLEEIGDVEN